MNDTPTSLYRYRYPLRQDGRMSQQRRTATMLLRLTPDDREEVKRRAAQAGMSVQEYATARLLDRPNVRFRPGGVPGQGRLPLTG